MAADNTTLNSGSGGDDLATLGQSGGPNVPTGVSLYCSSFAAGANVLVNPVAVALADGLANPTVPPGPWSPQFVFNGTTWDRVAGGAGAVGAGVQRTTLASDDPAVTALEIIDDWDETNRAAVNLIAGQVAITAGAGAVAANTPRTTLASDDPAVTALEIIDDWDETNRAAVNIIAGQVGVQGGSGVTNALTQRVVLATDVALPAGTNTVGNFGVVTRTTGGATPGQHISAATNNATNVKASAGTLYMATAMNKNASPRYLKLYDKATAPTPASDTPVQTYMIPGNTSGAGLTLPLPAQGMVFGSGIGFAIVGGMGVNDDTAVGAEDVCLSYAYS